MDLQQNEERAVIHDYVSEQPFMRESIEIRCAKVSVFWK